MALQKSISSFLHFAKGNFLAAIEKSQKITIVIGNESADLDSLTSALLYSYLRSSSPPPNAFTPLYIPVLNIPASDIRIRPEFTAVFRYDDINPEHLITRDDFPSIHQIEKILDPVNTRWILLDHNELQGELGSIYSTRVHGVIDHHEDENAIPQKTDPEPRVIEKCGSCTSLVVRTLRSTWDQSMSLPPPDLGTDASRTHDSSTISAWNSSIAKMALATILIDTANLKAEGKVEEADREAVKYLENIIRLSPKDASSWDRTSFYNHIDEAKRSVDGLKFGELLRKDYKEWTENGMKLGISSSVKPLGFLVSKAQEQSAHPAENGTFDKNVNEYMTARSLSIFAIMTTSKTPNKQLRRELFLLASSPESLKAISKFSERAISELGLKDMTIEGTALKNNTGDLETESSAVSKVWLQNDVSKSRKQVAPLLREAMQEALR